MDSKIPSEDLSDIPQALPSKRIDHKFIGAITLALSVLLLSLVYFRSNTQKKVLTEPKKSIQLPYQTKPSLPPIFTAEKTSKPSKSPGIFYPFNNGAVVNNNFPTIIGKIHQKSGVYLHTTFGIEKSPVNGDEENFLRFAPGQTNDLIVKIDGKETGVIYGVAQYPTVMCKTINVFPNGTTSLNPNTGVKSPPDDVYTTLEECLSQKSSDIPPLIFFTKPTSPLKEGKHIMDVEGYGDLQEMVFYVDSNMQPESQDMYVIDKSVVYPWDHGLLDSSDSCSEGYHYDTNYLTIPLALYDNENISYGISFPQSRGEVQSMTQRPLQIAFDGKRFDLFFPQSSVFFEGKLFKRNELDNDKALFLPKDHLVFENGYRASYIDAYQIIPKDGNYARAYFEIFPFNVSGGTYNDLSMPWITSGSSSCDG